MDKLQEISNTQQATANVSNSMMKETDSLETKEWAIFTALDRILSKAKGSGLTKEFWDDCQSPISFLCEKLDMKPIQVVLLAVLIEKDKAIKLSDIGEYLGCNRLNVLAYSEEIAELVDKRWVLRSAFNKINEYTLAKGVVAALQHNERFVAEKLEGLTAQEFIIKITSEIEEIERFGDFGEDLDRSLKMIDLCVLNPQLDFCREVLKYDNNYVKFLLLAMAKNYAMYGNTEYGGIDFSTIDCLFPTDFFCDSPRRRLRDGSHILLRNKVIEYHCEGGMADTDSYCFTDNAKNTFLADFAPQDLSESTQRTFKELKLHDSFKEKAMFYNAEEEKQIERLADLLLQENLLGVQQRLAEQGLHRGFAYLFYGEAGTGKTETVLQLARKTGRDIMQIDIAGIRDKFVGESEKNIKAIFSRYRTICKNLDVKPILFFNEADAIFGKRTTAGINPSVEKMDNAMQNILLQEMEDFDGILIATTNLTENFDNAFDRRFLFKVEFRKPSVAVKTRLWRSMLGGIVNENDANTLASRYDFSGGQIENVARKRTIEYILSGKEATFSEIDEYCRQESLAKKGAQLRPIGFMSA